MIVDDVIRKLKEKSNKEIDEKGYIKSMNPEDNLCKTINNWNEIKDEIGKGQGGELKIDRSGRIKFCALHSSSALCVNNFTILKNNLKGISFLQNSNFTKAVFEKKVPTGISTPNLDFYLENSKAIIGVESKFTEYFTSNIEHTKQNLCKYFMREDLKYLPRLFDSIIFNYLNSPEKMFLDVAQLIKHSIGLIRNKGEKKAILVYIYWEPKSWNKKGEYQEIYEQHKYEIEEFAKKISKFIIFKNLSYTDFWECFKEYKDIDEIKEKYELEI